MAGGAINCFCCYPWRWAIKEELHLGFEMENTTLLLYFQQSKPVTCYLLDIAAFWGLHEDFHHTLPLNSLTREESCSASYSTEKLRWFYFDTSAEFVWVSFLHKQKVPKGCIFKRMLIWLWVPSVVVCSTHSLFCFYKCLWKKESGLHEAKFGALKQLNFQLLEVERWHLAYLEWTLLWFFCCALTAFYGVLSDLGQAFCMGMSSEAKSCNLLLLLSSDLPIRNSYFKSSCISSWQSFSGDNCLVLSSGDSQGLDQESRHWCSHVLSHVVQPFGLKKKKELVE